MGLIKKNRIEESGTVSLEEASLEVNSSLSSYYEDSAGEEETATATISPSKGSMAVEDAQSESMRILEEARNEAAGIKEQAQSEGLEIGKKEGRADLAARIEEAMETINQAVKERENIIKDAESEILRLSIRVAEQIVRSEVSLHRDVCLNIVSEAIQRVSDREQIIIRVNREDLDQVKKHKDRIAGLADGVKSFSVLEDSHVEPGGCMIETNLGFVDARISTKIAAIEEAFKKAENTET